jgi:hypothetical protein
LNKVLKKLKKTTDCKSFEVDTYQPMQYLRHISHFTHLLFAKLLAEVEMPEGNIDYLEPIINIPSGVIGNPLPSGPPVEMEASLRTGVYTLTLTNAPLAPQNYNIPGFPHSWAYAIGTSISIQWLDSADSTPRGLYLAMDRNNNCYFLDCSSRNYQVPPFRTSNLGQINENVDSAFHLVSGGENAVLIRVNEVKRKVGIRCDILMEDDVQYIFNDVTSLNGPYGVGRWQKRYESGVLAKGNSSNPGKVEEINVTTTYLLNNPHLTLKVLS